MRRYYRVDIRELSDPAKDESVLCGLPQERREKCLRYQIESDRKRCLGAGKIIQRILKEYGDGENVRTAPNGKPEADGVFFNVSHSGNYVIGVVADSPIGCDIEKMKKAPIVVADHYFTQSEQKYIKAQADQELAFWKLWTLKESYVKMTGEGLSVPLNQFELVFEQDVELYRENQRQHCVLTHMVFDGYSIAVCEEVNGYA